MTDYVLLFVASVLLAILVTTLFILRYRRMTRKTKEDLLGVLSGNQVGQGKPPDLPVPAKASGPPPEPPEPYGPPTSSDPPLKRPRLGWLNAMYVYLGIFLFYLILITIGLWNTTEATNTTEGGVKWGLVAFVAMLCHLVSSLKVVTEKEIGLSILFGVILDRLESGPHFIPWPMRLTRFTKNQITVHFGTLNPEDKDLVEASQNSDNWFVEAQPIRINWGDISSSHATLKEKKEHDNDPLAQRLTTDPHLYFSFRISDPRSLVEEAGGVVEAMNFIKGVCITALQEQAGKTFVARAVKEVDLISRNIRDRVEELVWDPQGKKRIEKKNLEEPDPNKKIAIGRSWGVDIVDVRVKDLGTPHATNTGMANRSEAIARADAEKTAAYLKAEGEENRLLREGRGKKAARIAEGEGEEEYLTRQGLGRAAAAHAVAEVLKTPEGLQAGRLQAWKDGMEFGKVILMPVDSGGLMKEIIGAGIAVKATEGAEKGAS